MPVHFAGRPGEMGALLELAAQHDLRVIEGCAHAIESEIEGQAAGAERFGMRSEDTPIATAIGRRTLSLPLSASLADHDVDDVVKALSLSLG